MRTLIPSVTALALGLGAAAAVAQDQQPRVAPQTASAAAPSGDKMICRYMYHQGTLVRTQTCHTQHEWDALRNYNQRQITEAQQRGMTSSPMH